MTLTLRGRLETRLVLLLLLALPWALAIAPLLPRPAGTTLEDLRRVLLVGLGLVAVASVVWELVYHALQQLRWNKDWPSIFGLLSVFSEGAVVWVLLHRLGVVAGSSQLSSAMFPAFTWFMGSTWLVTWLVMQGPLRVLLPRWRYEGGSILRAPAALRARHHDVRAEHSAAANPTVQPTGTDRP